jgi:nucleoside-diphosphate-sugar epimerase
MMESMLVVPGKIYRESDSGSAMVEATKKMTETHPLYAYRGFAAYMAAKRLALDAVWNFRAEHAPKFAITTLHPVSIIGRPAFMPSSPEKLSPSFQPIVRIWRGPPDAEMPPQLAQGAFVDVWDVAEAHVWAFENPGKADGEQFILSAGFGPPQARADIMREKFEVVGERFIKGTPGGGYVPGKDCSGRETRYWYPEGASQVSGEKFAKEASFAYKRLEVSVVESVQGLEEAYASR